MLVTIYAFQMLHEVMLLIVQSAVLKDVVIALLFIFLLPDSVKC